MTKLYHWSLLSKFLNNDNMATPCESKAKFKSKIPRYKYSQIPVCSKSYKKIQKEVKEKKISINNKSGEVEKLTSSGAENSQNALFFNN